MSHPLRTGSRSTSTLFAVALLSIVGVACGAPSTSNDGTPGASPSSAVSPTRRRSPRTTPPPLGLNEESPVQTLDGGIEIHDVSWDSPGTERVSPGWSCRRRAVRGPGLPAWQRDRSRRLPGRGRGRGSRRRGFDRFGRAVRPHRHEPQGLPAELRAGRARARHDRPDRGGRAPRLRRPGGARRRRPGPPASSAIRGAPHWAWCWPRSTRDRARWS